VPELPEVESVRRQLAPLIEGRTITQARRDPYPSRRIGSVERAVGGTIGTLRRRGKFLLAPLAGDAAHLPAELVLHLGMTGMLRVLAPDDDEGALGTSTHVRVRFALDDGRILVFRDARRFGRVSVIDPGRYLPDIPTLAHLGPEPLSEDFDVAAFARRLQPDGAPVKARLLDQRVVAGVGNIYADESLWRARIHPGARRVGRERARVLHGSIREVLAAAIEREGTTFRDYRMVNGQSGRYLTELDAYGRAGLPCSRCGTTMRGATIAARGTTYCPKCQAR
jgi:formamidopyrimidine-DNA glycosylase